ncbi:MAG: hypothetical protein ACRDRQ_04555 [Pseudonocardiaceae bacterium]
MNSLVLIRFITIARHAHAVPKRPDLARSRGHKRLAEPVNLENCQVGPRLVVAEGT